MVDRRPIPGSARIPSRPNPMTSQVVRPTKPTTGNEDDEVDDIINSIIKDVTTPTTTTTAAPRTTSPTTTVQVRESSGGIQGTLPPLGQPYADFLDRQIENEAAKIAGLTSEQLDQAKRGEMPVGLGQLSPDSKGGLTWGSVGKFFLSRILSPIPGVALDDLDKPKRLVISTLYETAEALPGRELKFSTPNEILLYKEKFPEDKKQYKVGDVIPTSKPRVSDWWNNIMNEPKFGFGTAFARHAKYESIGGAFDLFNAKFTEKDAENGLIPDGYKVGDTKPDWMAGASTTGSKWGDRAIGFIGDVALDPLTYATLGTGTAVNMSGKALIRVSGQRLTEDGVMLLVDDAARLVLDDVARGATRNLAKNSAERLTASATNAVGEAAAAASARELKTIGRGLNVQALKIARETLVEAGDTAGVKLLDKELAKAANAYSAIAPARHFGAKSRETLAGDLLGLRDEALVEAQRFAGTARGRVAQEFVDTISDDVIADIAQRGTSALRGDVARVLGTPGGIRLGMPKSGAAVTIPGTGGLTAQYGRGYSKLRQLLARTPRPLGRAYTTGLEEFGFKGLVPRAISDLITPFGQRGQVGTQTLFDARVGLRRGLLSGPDAVRAVRVLADDKVYKSFKSLAMNSAKQRLRNLFDAGAAIKGQKFYKTVYQLMSLPQAVLTSGNINTIKDAIVATGGSVARDITPEEVRFAVMLKEYATELVSSTADAIARGLPEEVAVSLRGVTPDAIKSGWFPLVLSDDAIKFLQRNRNNKMVQDMLVSLGISPEELSAPFIREIPRLGNKWFGDTLKLYQTAGGESLLPGGNLIVPQANGQISIDVLNELARRGGFKGDFFDTNIASALEKYTERFADDYAFLRMLDFYNAKTPYGGTPDSPFADTVLGKIGDIATRETLRDARKAVEFETVDDFIKYTQNWANGIQAFYDASLRRFSQLSDQFQRTGDTQALQNWGSFTNFLGQMIDEAQRFAIRARDTAATFENILPDKDLLAELTILWDDLSSRVKNIVDIGTLGTNQQVYVDLLDKVERNPNLLRNALKLGEDIFIQLDRSISPEAMVKAEVASMYKNFKQFDNPAKLRGLVDFIKKYNTFIKSWIVAYPGYHTVNGIGNVFAMIAGGGKPSNLTEGLNLLRTFKQWVAENGDLVRDFNLSMGQIAPGPGAAPRIFTTGTAVDALLDEFAIAKNIPMAKITAMKEAIANSGTSGITELAEIFGPTAKPLGFLGGVRKRENFLNKSAGWWLQQNREVADIMEEYSRFIFTYDGIRQGLSPQMAGDRTLNFLFDYGDRSVVDNFMGQVYPFWTWMARNLPMQVMNMATNPAPYRTYFNFRQNFEDEETGENVFLPDYLKKGGRFLVGTSYFGTPIAVRLDLGIPPLGGQVGTGGQNPLMEGLLGPLTAPFAAGERGAGRQIVNELLAPVTPALRAPIEAYLTGQKAFSGEEFNETGEGTRYALQQILGAPLSSVGRLAGPALAGQFEKGTVPGTISKDIFGIRPGEPGISDMELKIRALASLVGSPIVPITPVEENVGRNEVLDLLRWLQEQGYKTS